MRVKVFLEVPLCLLLCLFYMTSAIANTAVNTGDSAGKSAGESAGEDDFECRFSLSDGEASLRVFTLSAEVYACMKQSGFRDVKLVNSLNQPVPFTRFSQDVESKEQIEKTLPFYQEPELTAFKTKDQIRRLSTLAGVSAQRDSSREWNIKNTFYSAILVDVSEDDVLRGLRINMDVNAPAIAATVVVERSNDLTTWTTVASPKKIVFVDNGVEKLRDGRIVVHRNVRGKYLRIAVLSNLKNVTKNISSVTTKYESIKTAASTLQWQRAMLQLVDEKNPVWVAALPSYLPVSSMRMSPAKDIVYYQGRLFADTRLSMSSTKQSLRREGKKKLKRVVKQVFQPRADDNGLLKGVPQWHHVSQFSPHFSQEHTAAPEATIISFPREDSRHWLMMFDQPASLNENQLPIIDFGWQADKLVFLAQGEPPFTLLVGRENKSDINNRVDAVAFPFDVLRPTSQNERVQPERVDITRISTPSTIDSAKAMKTQVDAEKIPWLTILLWLVLLAGISVMGFMAYQLAKKMKQDQ
jgi:hypothetical protein